MAFGTALDGDGRSDMDARRRIAQRLDISSGWATMEQVHGARVVRVGSAGKVEATDGLVTSTRCLPLVAGTADCVPLVLVGGETRAIVHAGWRGIAAGIIEIAGETMHEAGDPPSRAVIGPHIGPCCYEVGPEVIDAIGGHRATTRWGTDSVHLAEAVRARLDGVDITEVGGCTRDDERFASHRRDQTSARQVTVTWIPMD
ncbi:MAG: polyphenol oxidase family protein [Acidimicrobiia bacterium]